MNFVINFSFELKDKLFNFKLVKLFKNIKLLCQLLNRKSK